MGELFDKLANYGNSGIYPFHMPGHKRQKTVDFNPYKIDITEIEGFDNLHHAEGVLLEAQKKAEKLYGSEESHFLINGSTAGIMSGAIASTEPYQNQTPMVRFATIDSTVAAMTPSTRPITAPL